MAFIRKKQSKPGPQGKKNRKKRFKQKRQAIQKDKFYRSWEWKTARYKALMHYGRVCFCCGVTPEDGKVLVVDHIVPRRKRPDLSLSLSNLQVLCNDCNMGKGAWDETDFRTGEKLPDGAYEHLKEILDVR